MPVTINGTTGIAGVDGSAGTPAIQGSDTNTGIRFGTDTVGLVTGGSDRLFIDSSGRVGIGTGSPNSLLHISGNNGIRFGAGSTPEAEINYTSAGNEFFDLKCRGTNGTVGNIRFFTGNTSGAAVERMIITNAGNVGIGTQNPVFLTDVLSGTANTGANVNNPSQLSVTGPNKSLTAGGATVFINSNSDLAIDTGGSIALSGRNTTSSTNSVVWGVIKGAKENATSTNTAGYLAFASANHNIGGLVEAMRIDSSQRLLVGTNSAESQLTVSSSSSIAYTTAQVGNNLTLANPNTASNVFTGIRMIASGPNNAGTASINCTVTGNGDGALTFSTRSSATESERMRVEAAGRLLIGKTSSSLNNVGLEFNPNGEISSSINYSASNQAWVLNNINASAATYTVDFRQQNTSKGDIRCSSTGVSYTSVSDYRLKENVLPVTDGITRLQQLKPSRFNFIVDQGKTVDGFIAHEVQSVVPEAITGEKDAVDEDGNPIYQGIDQSKLVPLLTAALQEAIGEIESLKTRVAALEST